MVVYRSPTYGTRSGADQEQDRKDKAIEIGDPVDMRRRRSARSRAFSFLFKTGSLTTFDMQENNISTQGDRFRLSSVLNLKVYMV